MEGFLIAMTGLLAAAAVVFGVLIMTADPIGLARRLARVEAQRDRAWRALSAIEDALADRPSIERLAWILAGSHGVSDVEEYNAVVTVPDEDVGEADETIGTNARRRRGQPGKADAEKRV